MAFFHAHLQLALLFFLRSAASTCFNPDGSAVTDTDYQPCNLVANSISMCCATNRPVGVRDQCLSNGLCFNPCGDDGNCGGLDKGNYWRESCTDQSWNSPNCLRGVCSNSADGGKANSTIAMSQCSTDGSWCCGANIASDVCCAMKGRITLAATVGISSSTTDSPKTIISTVTPTLTSSPAPNITSSPASSPASSITPPSSPSHREEKIGLGVGIGVGVPTIAAILAFFLWQRRKHLAGNISQQGKSQYQLDAENNSPSYRNINVELDAEHQRVPTHHEISATSTKHKVPLHEMSATSARSPIAYEFAT